MSIHVQKEGAAICSALAASTLCASFEAKESLEEAKEEGLESFS